MISCVLCHRAICKRARVLIPRALDDSTQEEDDQARLEPVEEFEDFMALHCHTSDRLRAVAFECHIEQQAAGKGGVKTICPGCGLGDEDHA